MVEGRVALMIVSHRIHGTGLFTCIWFNFLVNVGTVNVPYMDPMGLVFLSPSLLRFMLQGCKQEKGIMIHNVVVFDC